MGIFDSLIGSNTTNATNAATAAQIPALWGVTVGANQVLQDTTNQGNAALTSYGKQATDALGSGYDNAYMTLGSAGGAAQNQLNGRTDQAVGTALSGNSAFQPAAASGGAASTMLGSILGLNGAGGTATARSAFTASPGYQFSVDQATDAAARKASALGLAGSGNTLDAITRLGSNLADQEYGNWTTQLQNAGAQGLAAASGISANDKAASGYQSTAGTTGAALEQSLGNSLATTQANKGTGTANIYTGLGTDIGNNDTLLGRLISTNNTNTAASATKFAMGDASAQDAASNANNGIFSKLLGGLASLPMGGGSSLGGKALSGLSSAFQL